MIILLGSYKGGCGKSTLATSLAAMLAGAGGDVVLVDADKQSTASTWAADREADPSLPAVACVQKYDNIRQTLLAITPAEQQHLSCLISTEEKQRRDTQRKATQRRARGVVERGEYEYKAQERRQQALDLKGTGMTQAAIAEALGVSQKTVSRYLPK